MHDFFIRAGGLPNTFARGSAFVIVSALALAGCSQNSSSAAACTLQLGGNTSASLDLPSCAVLSASSDAGVPDYQLSFQAKTAQLAQLDVSIDLGSSPAPGSFSSETANNWNATGLTAGNCAFSAGNAAVPPGSFTLTLSSVDTASSIAHGSLDLTMYVQSPPGTDCGVGNGELATIDF